MCREPLVLEISDRAREILVHAGWISYFTKLEAPNSEVAIEFLQNLRNGQSMVKGGRITISEVVIDEVSRLPKEGTIWPKKNVMLQGAVEIFKDVGEELTKKGKGIQLFSLGEPWHELEGVV